MTRYVLGKQGKDWAYLSSPGPIHSEAEIYSDGTIWLDGYEIGDPMTFISDLEELMEWGAKLFCEAK